MTISADILRRLSVLRLSRAASAEVLSIIAEIESGNEARKAKDRARKSRGNSVEIPSHTDNGNSVEIPVEDVPPDKERSPTPPKEINPPSSLRSEKKIPPGGGPSAELFELSSQERPKTNGHGHQYPDEFEAVWYEYLPIAPKSATKADAFLAWKKLNSEERKLCWTGVVNYAVWLLEERKKKPDTSVKHLATFINKRGWEPFMENRT